MKKTIVLFRKDLRIHDHPPLYYAAERGVVIPVFIYENHTSIQLEVASNWWLHHSLISLKKRLSSINTSLIIRQGNLSEEVLKLILETNADAVFLNNQYTAEGIREDHALVKMLNKHHIEVQTFDGNILFNPKYLLNQQQKPYKVFTAFWNKFKDFPVDQPLSIPAVQESTDAISSLTVEDLKLIDTSNNWVEKFEDKLFPGEVAAISKWESFAQNKLVNYKNGRDFPAANQVTNLSPYIAHGEISIKALWYATKRASVPEEQTEAFLRQLMWREFSINQLFHNPNMAKIPLRDQFEKFPWKGTSIHFSKWKKGQTGYPLVDAGMRELWETGTMHNRVRMVVASFLTKHLLISWVEGVKWFQHTLVDYDEANNANGWQWTAGCGIDNSPYFRIFNPILQSEKFDKQGEYISKWLPELAALPAKYIHNPSVAPIEELNKANITLGITYPYPIVDHKTAREKALMLYHQIK